MSAPGVVYVVSRWGEPSQTFVRREAVAVRDGGVSVHAASLKRPVPTETGITALWLGPISLLVGLARIAIRRPRQVFGTFATIVSARPPLRNAVSHLVSAAVGISWVGSRRLPPGHLHSQFGWVAATATWAAARCDDRSFSVMLHAFEIHDARYRDRFTPIPLLDALEIFTISERDQAIIEDRWRRRPLIARIGVDDAWLQPPVTVRDDHLIVSVGRLIEKKGFPTLIQAIARCHEPWRVEIIGDGPLDTELRDLIVDLGLRDRVRLLGSLPEGEVRRSMQRASIMCLASREAATGDRDGTPTVIIEAMASGAVVVASDVGAIGEQIGHAGVLVPPGDVGALSNALDALADQERRLELQRLGHDQVIRSWTSAITAKTLINHLGLT